MVGTQGVLQGQCGHGSSLPRPLADNSRLGSLSNLERLEEWQALVSNCARTIAAVNIHVPLLLLGSAGWG